MTARHKVFISYHHANDEKYKNQFEQRFANQFNAIISGSINDGDIDPNLKTETIRQKIRDDYLRDTSVTIVLIGTNTWQRKHVDWEISSSIRDTKHSPRSGLLGIFLPSYRFTTNGKYTPGTIPPRLYDNVECGYAEVYGWTDNAATIKKWVHEAYLRKNKKGILPTNKRDMFAKNRTASSW